MIKSHFTQNDQVFKVLSGVIYLASQQLDHCCCWRLMPTVNNVVEV